MKAAAFAYARARSTAHAVELLAEHPGSRPVAGGQSLGPMLNLRLARPTQLVDIRQCPDLRRYEESSDAVVYGAGITHAEIEDGTVPDPSPGWLRHAARSIAYRAIRNRGTIGGSLAHADPAADWPVVLAALGAEVWIDGPDGPRAEPLPSFLRGPFATTLAPGELVTAVRVPRPTGSARFGYSKLAAKSGEFAQALAVVFEDPERGTRRAAIGAIERARPGRSGGWNPPADGGTSSRRDVPARGTPPEPARRRRRQGQEQEQEPPRGAKPRRTLRRRRAHPGRRSASP